MRFVSSDHKQAWKNQLSSPCALKRRQPPFKLRFPLSDYPAGERRGTLPTNTIRRCLDTRECWTRERFIEAGLPHRDLPANKNISCSVSEAGLRKLLAERRKLGPMSGWDWETYNNIHNWTLTGVPDNARPLLPADSRHKLSSQELTLVLDKIARFLDEGFMYGPIDKKDWPMAAPHCISTFVRYQKNDEGVRIINNCSYPAGRSINDSNLPDLRHKYPYKMAQPADLIKDVLDFGPTAVLLIVKIDLSNAFK